MWYAKKRRRGLRGLGVSSTAERREEEEQPGDAAFGGPITIGPRPGPAFGPLEPTPQERHMQVMAENARAAEARAAEGRRQLGVRQERDALAAQQAAAAKAARAAGPRTKNKETGQWEGKIPEMTHVGTLPFQSGRTYDPTIGTAPVYWGQGKAGPAGERDILASVQNLSMLKYGGYDPKVQGGGVTQTNPNQVLYEGRYVAPEMVALLEVTKGPLPVVFEHEYVPTINTAAPVSDIMSEFAQRAVQRQWDMENAWTPSADASASIPTTISPGFSTQQSVSAQYSGQPAYQDEVPQGERPDRPPTAEERAEFVETMAGLNHYAYGRLRGMAALEQATAYTYEPPPIIPPPTPRPRPGPAPTQIPGLYPTAQTVPFVGGPVQMLITQPQVSAAQLNLRNAIRAAQEQAVRNAQVRAEQEKARWEAEQYKIRKLQSIGGASAAYEISDIERNRRLRLRDEQRARGHAREELDALLELTDVRNTQRRGSADFETWQPPAEESRWIKLLRRASRGMAVDYAVSQGLSPDAAERVGDAYVQGGEVAAKVQGYREGAPLAAQAAWGGVKAAVPKIPGAAKDVLSSVRDSLASAWDQAKEALVPTGEALREKAEAARKWAEAKAAEGEQAVTSAVVSQRAGQEFDKALAAFARPTFNQGDTSQISNWATKLKLGFALTQEALVSATGDRDVSIFGMETIPAENVLQLKQILSWVDNKYGAQLSQSLSEAMSQDDFDHPGRQWSGALDTLRLIDRLRYDLKILAPQNVDVAEQKLFSGPLKLTAPAGEHLLPGPVLVADATPSWGSEHDIYAPDARRGSTMEAAEAALARAQAVAARADAQMRAAQVPQVPFQFPQGVVLEARSRELPELQVRRRAVTGQAQVSVGAQPARTVRGQAQVEVASPAQKLGERALEKLGQIFSGAPSTQTQIRQIEQRLRETAGDAGQDFAIDQERSRLFAERGRLQRSMR